MKCALRLLISGLTIFSALALRAQTPEWIWNDGAGTPANGETCFVRHVFKVQGAVTKAMLAASADNHVVAFINGENVGSSDEWQEPLAADVTKLLKPGENVIALRGLNDGGSAAIVARLVITTGKNNKQTVATDGSWLSSKTAPEGWEKPAFAAVGWAKPKVIGKLGDAPWNDVLAGAVARPRGTKRVKNTTILDPLAIVAAPNFKVDLIYTIPNAEQGSWVSLTVDPQGRLIASDQNRNGNLWRVTLPKIGVEAAPVVEKIDTPLAGAHGLLYAFKSLYVMVNEQPTSGVYRLRDTDGKGTFGPAELIVKIDGHGEHGPHGITPGPDGKSIYFNSGNHTKLPADLERMLMADAWGEDHILPRMWDANGHARGILAPGGQICRADPDGKHVELFCGGFRNQYACAFDPNGELFTYDSDMEWDIGTPWYKPTRINHCVSGGDFGWRSGQGNWPPYYADCLPAIVDIGPGSPTDVIFGYGAKFPAKYQRAFFANDWTYGTMYAIILKPKGGSYAAVKEEFISGKPLPFTGSVINPLDGAMYFLVGGRGGQGALYRVTYTGSESTAPVQPLPFTPEIKLRRALETLQQPGIGPDAIEKAWPYLSHEDRFVRFAARIAIEKQDAKLWSAKAFSEKKPDAIVESMIALARVGKDPALQPQILDKLNKLDLKQQPLDRQIAMIRAYELAYTRLGKPSAEACAQQAKIFDGWFPHADDRMNHELSQLLIFLDSPTAVAKTMALFTTARDNSPDVASAELLARNDRYGGAVNGAHDSRPNQRQIGYAMSLRNAKTGWTPELRKTFFSWFPLTAPWKGGNSFRGFIKNIRSEALANFAPENEKAELTKLSEKMETAKNYVPPKGPGKAYTVEAVVALAKDGLHGRNFENGKAMFSSALCASCHHFAGDGGNVGPDLTGIGNRYTLHDLAENIVEPSKVISDLYGSHEITKNDGTLVIGRIIAEENGELLVMCNPLAPDQLTKIPLADIKSKKVTPVSMMPPSLINPLNEDELLDLLAYLRSGGNPNDKAFAK